MEGANATVVTFGVEILSLDDIRELDMTLNVQFRLTLSWKDPRIVFYNLKVQRNPLSRTSPLVTVKTDILRTHCT